MHILGISGGPRPKKQSGVYALVETVLRHTGHSFELIALRGKCIGGCIACLGCVQDNICKLEDDLTPLRDAIVSADAYVFGAPNYYSTLNATMHAFMERWFQFRHQEGNTLWGKLGVAVGVGGTTGAFPAGEIEKFFMYNLVETVAKVDGRGAASCYTCGYGETCKVGIPRLVHGKGKINPAMIPDVRRQPRVMEAAVNAGKQLGRRLAHGHDRQRVTQRIQRKLKGIFEATV